MTLQLYNPQNITFVREETDAEEPVSPSPKSKGMFSRALPSRLSITMILSYAYHTDDAVKILKSLSHSSARFYQTDKRMIEAFTVPRPITHIKTNLNKLHQQQLQQRMAQLNAQRAAQAAR